MQGNRCRRSWINQRCVNHSPLLVRPEIDGCASFTFHFLNGEVQRSAGNFAHSVLLISRWSAVPIFYLRTQLGITRSRDGLAFGPETNRQLALLDIGCLGATEHKTWLKR